MTASGEYRHRPLGQVLKGLLRSDSILTFVWFYYLFFIIGSVHLTFFARPIGVIIGPMGQFLYDMWTWMPLVAAPTALTGLALRHGGSPATSISPGLLRRDFLGLWMQVGGHGCMFIVLLVFISTAIYGAEPGQPVPSAYWLMAYLVGVSVLTAQCVDKIGLGKGWWT